MTTASTLGAQIGVDPKGVNVNAQAATTVFLTFGGLREQVPAESFWCGALVSAAPDRGQRCDPGTIFGRLPARYDLSRQNGVSFTDVMSVPPSVARRAYQAAAAGADAPFFYVRRFVSTVGGPDEYVPVTCRLTTGGARVPFSLTEVTLAFDVETPLVHVRASESVPAISARVRYTGTGRLTGRWEVVLPGEELPDRRDLLTEASLPPDERGTQRRYTEVGRFNVFLPPGGGFTLEGPPPERMPSSIEGTYLLLLRIEAGDDREADSNFDAAGASGGIVHSAAVAGFPMPVLRYVVGGDSGDDTSAGEGSLRLITPAEASAIPPDKTIEFSWTAVRRAALYRLEIRNNDAEVFTAMIADAAAYRSPPWLAARIGEDARWRITALDVAGARIARSDWQPFRSPQ